MKSSLVVRVALATLPLSMCFVSGQSYAQKTYRCGNTYQSIPCAAADGKGSTVKMTDSGTAQKPAGPVDAKAKPGTPVPVAASAAPTQPSEADKKLAAAKQAEAEADKKNVAAAAEKKSKCDKIRNDLNYNTSQLRAGGSNVTQDRLNGERRQLNDQFSKESCQT